MKTITDANFEKEVLENKQPFLLDMTATWCGPCKTMTEHLNRLEQKFPEVDFGKADVDANPKLCEWLKVQSVPMLFMFKGRDLVAKKVGLVSQSELKQWIDKSKG